MDAFFASVEQLDEPSLRGRPVLVGGAGRRGVVAAASYEARPFGCGSAMPMAVALRLCPGAVVRPGRFDRYRELSRAVFEILHGVTPLVQPLSIDEAFCDVTGSLRLLGSGRAIGESVRRRVRAEVGLTCSVGVAPNKFLAKLASELDKPDGLRVIEPDGVLAALEPLPVSRLWGVGAAAEKKLHRLGLRTVGDIRRAGEAALAGALGEFGGHLHRLSLGLDDRPVTPDREAKSISHERTFGDDLAEPAEVRAVLDGQAEDVCRRLRAHGRLARGVVVKIRYGDFETVTRSATLGGATGETASVRAAARGLFDAWCRGGPGGGGGPGFRPVRLIGVGVQQLTGPSGGKGGGESGGSGEQLGLFDAGEREKQRALDAVSDAIAAKHGKGAVRRGVSRGRGGD